MSTPTQCCCDLLACIVFGMSSVVDWDWMSTPTQCCCDNDLGSDEYANSLCLDRMGTPTQGDMICDTFVVVAAEVGSVDVAAGQGSRGGDVGDVDGGDKGDVPWWGGVRFVVGVGEGVRGGDDDGGVVGDKVADDGGERVTREAAAGVMAGWR
ncbi:hypothetical protein Tco_1166181 [Tanacetum coccineum]